MTNKYVISTLIFLVIILISLCIYKSQGIKRFYKAEVSKGLERSETLDNSIITKNDIKHLPKPVQKYLTYVGVIGKEKIKNLRIVLEGQFKMDPKKDWSPIRIEQYNFFNSTTRLSLNKLKVSGIPIIGLDSYINGKGKMLIKPVGLFTVVDATGEKMDSSGAIIHFNDMCLAAPATLIDKNIQWETIDSSKVKATFNNNGLKVSAELTFNEKGELTKFTTYDKYYSPTGKSYKRVKWSSVNKDYKDFNGLKLAAYGEAIWHFKEGDLCYGKVKLKEIEYNCESYK